MREMLGRTRHARSGARPRPRDAMGGPPVSEKRSHIKARLSAMERGLEGLLRRIDHLNDGEVDRIDRLLDDFSARYARLLNLGGLDRPR